MCMYIYIHYKKLVIHNNLGGYVFHLQCLSYLRPANRHTITSAVQCQKNWAPLTYTAINISIVIPILFCDELNAYVHIL
jgi:hypothetical protein